MGSLHTLQTRFKGIGFRDKVYSMKASGCYKKNGETEVAGKTISETLPMFGCRCGIGESEER